VHHVAITRYFDDEIPELLLEELQGARNDDYWRNYAPGKVLFLGATSGGKPEVRNKIPVRMEFACDPIFHLRQRCLCGSCGELKYKGREDAGTQPSQVGTPQDVVWYQPFPRTADFSLLGVG
jgi:hypothetical protein